MDCNSSKHDSVDGAHPVWRPFLLQELWAESLADAVVGATVEPLTHFQITSFTQLLSWQLLGF